MIASQKRNFDTSSNKKCRIEICIPSSPNWAIFVVRCWGNTGASMLPAQNDRKFTPTTRANSSASGPVMVSDSFPRSHLAMHAENALQHVQPSSDEHSDDSSDELLSFSHSLDEDSFELQPELESWLSYDLTSSRGSARALTMFFE